MSIKKKAKRKRKATFQKRRLPQDRELRRLVPTLECDCLPKGEMWVTISTVGDFPMIRLRPISGRFEYYIQIDELYAILAARERERDEIQNGQKSFVGE